MSHKITMDGKAVKILSAGKYCDRDMEVTAKDAEPLQVEMYDWGGGLIKAVATQGAGYTAGGEARAEMQLSTIGGYSITPSTLEMVIYGGFFIDKPITVKPIPASYIQPSGTKTIAENGTHDVKEYAAVQVEVAGIDTSDATVTAELMPSGVTAYAKGEKVTGTAQRVNGAFTQTAAPSFTTVAGGTVKLIQMSHTVEDPTYFGITGSTPINLQAETSEFGDAAAEDVAKGKTFTSAAGLQVVGTAEDEDLDTVLTEQEELIAQLKAVLAEKAAGGGESVPTQEKTVQITENGSTEILPDEGYALSKVGVTVNVPVPDGYIQPSGVLTITANGTHDVRKYDSARVLVPIPDGYIKPAGALEVTENGSFDVSEYSRVNVNVAGASEPDPLADFQRVEYIESAEAETYPYIITDIFADNDTGVEVIASFPTLADRIPMGSRNDNQSTRFYCTYPLSSTGSYYGFNTGSSLPGSFAVNTKYRCQTNFLGSRMAGIFDANGNRKSGGLISSTLTTQTAPIAIFGYNHAANGTVTSKREYKLYGAKISQGFEVIREYIPCYRKSDGVVGLYEKFTGTFLTAEAGAFAKGADIDW